MKTTTKIPTTTQREILKAAASGYTIWHGGNQINRFAHILFDDKVRNVRRLTIEPLVLDGYLVEQHNADDISYVITDAGRVALIAKKVR